VDRVVEQYIEPRREYTQSNWDIGNRIFSSVCDRNHTRWKRVWGGCREKAAAGKRHWRWSWAVEKEEARIEAATGTATKKGMNGEEEAE
jgi:hypothetical protein